MGNFTSGRSQFPTGCRSKIEVERVDSHLLKGCRDEDPQGQFRNGPEGSLSSRRGVDWWKECATGILGRLLSSLSFSIFICQVRGLGRSE